MVIIIMSVTYIWGKKKKRKVQHGEGGRWLGFLGEEGKTSPNEKGLMTERPCVVCYVFVYICVY